MTTIYVSIAVCLLLMAGLLRLAMRFEDEAESTDLGDWPTDPDSTKGA